jgi:hypothetical protein
MVIKTDDGRMSEKGSTIFVIRPPKLTIVAPSIVRKRTRMQLVSALPSLYCATATDERDQPDHKEHEEQNLSDAHRGSGKASKAKNRGDNRNYQKNQGPMQHRFFSPALCVAIKRPNVSLAAASKMT